MTAAAKILDSSSVLLPAAAKTGSAVQQLDKLVTTKLLGPDGTRSKVRRTVYLLNKRQIARLRKELTTAREELLEALAVESLFVYSRNAVFH